MAKNNRKLIESRIEELNNKFGYNLKLDIYDSSIDKISAQVLNYELHNFSGDSTDIDLVTRGKIYVMEIMVNDDEEVDTELLTQEEYIDRYGDERWDEE